MADKSSSRLFQPLQVGRCRLEHRIAMAPLTRYRASDEHVPLLPMVAEYYAQRASTPGTLLITEATFISARAGGYANVPGIYSDAQIEAWRAVTDAVHARGSFIYCQLWALGRTANPDVLERETGAGLVGASDVPMSASSAAPRPLGAGEIAEWVEDYARAARNAVAAGFDGVELHGANGYLIDQFLQDVSNRREDAYGGSVEGRSRFALEVAGAVAGAVGADRVGVRLSPFSTFQAMRMREPAPQFAHVIRGLRELGIAYLHLVESRVSGNADVAGGDSLDFALEAWGGRNPVLLAGGFKPDLALRTADEQYSGQDVVVVFGRSFLSTPDLPFRLRAGLEFNAYNRDTFYKAKSAEGYTDYPFSPEFEARGGATAASS